MSLQAIVWALDQKVPAIAKLVLISIGNCADKDGANAFPGQKTIAEDACLSERAVRYWIKWLEDGGWLSRERRRRANGSRSSDSYTLHIVRRTNRNRHDVPLENKKQPARGGKTYRHHVPGY